MVMLQQRVDSSYDSGFLLSDAPVFVLATHEAHTMSSCHGGSEGQLKYSLEAFRQ
jgi:hypothetical protein